MRVWIGLAIDERRLVPGQGGEMRCAVGRAVIYMLVASAQEDSSCEDLPLYCRAAAVMGRGAVMQEKPAIHVKQCRRCESMSVIT
jgi:hypothetical protein